MKLAIKTALRLNRLQEILSKLPRVKIGLIGDVCVDAYWKADMKRSELSRETPHFPLPIVGEYYSLGAAGNVAANLAALSVGQLDLISIAGKDWRSDILHRLLKEQGIDAAHLIPCDQMITPAYCKPIRTGISNVEYEDPRLDFTNFCSLPIENEVQILEHLSAVADRVDVLAVSDQFPFGCISERVREQICAIGQKIPVVVDSRDRAGLYKNTIIKPNETEAGEMLKKSLTGEDWMQQVKAAGKSLGTQTGKPVIITLGAGGSFYWEEEAVFVPAVPTEGLIDFVGAGDTFLSAVCAALAAGAKGTEAIAFGNIASSITIQKLGTTGVATPEEIMCKYKEIQEGDS